jgi:mRNA (guanine-N7-)-methyltransferase
MNQTKAQRATSYFYNMRKFHNSIKRSLYEHFAKNTDNVLELAVGKGGDLDKWISNGIKNVVGYDIDTASIEECQRRVTERNDPKTKVNVAVKDLSREILLGEQSFDVVSCMFAFHYFFASKDTFNVIIQSVLNNIKPGGIFMGTMFDGDSLHYLNKHNKFELKDKQELRFRLNFKERTTSQFGNKVSVFIKDTVLDQPMDEYIVLMGDFISLMKGNRFELLETYPFQEYVPWFHPKLSPVEQKVSFLNRTFVFKKN